MQISDVVEKLRRQLFAVWVTTNDQGVIAYRTRPIETCPGWTPGPYWTSWIILGPPAGDVACALLSDLSAEPKASGDDKMPIELISLLNDKFTSRKDQRDSGKAVAAATAAKVMEPSTSSTPVKLLPDRPRDGIKLFNAYTKERELRLQRVEKLLLITEKTSTFFETYTKEYKSILEEPLITLQSCLEHLSGDLRSPLSVRSCLASPLSFGSEHPSSFVATIDEFVAAPAIFVEVADAGLGATSFVIQTDQMHQNLSAPFADRTCVISAADRTATVFGQDHLGQTLLGQAPENQTKVTKETYFDWLERAEKFSIVPAAPDGACLFESTLHCLKEIWYSDSAWAEDAMFQMNWREATVIEFRLAILLLMKNMQTIPFDALTNFGHNSFRGLILEEGIDHGIMDHALRNSGNPPQLYSSTAEYFELMKKTSAYGNQSALLAIAILCNVTVNVYIAPGHEAEVYNPGQQQAIYLVKMDRGSHYDAMSKNVSLSYLRHGEPQGDNTYKYNIDYCILHGGAGIALGCFVCQQGHNGQEYFEDGFIEIYAAIPQEHPRTPGGATDPDDANRQKSNGPTISPGLHIDHAAVAVFKKKMADLIIQHEKDQEQIDDQFDRNRRAGNNTLKGTIFEFDVDVVLEPAAIAANYVSEDQTPSQTKSQAKSTVSLDRRVKQIAAEHCRHANLVQMLPKKNVSRVVFGYLL